VLSLLTQKIERQIRSLGSVGDVLGRLQVERIEGLLSKTPGDIQAAVQEADREIDDEIRRAGGTALLSVLGDGSLDESELSAARQAADRGASASVNLVDFLCAAVVAAGGTARRNGTVHVATPRSWISSSVRPAYERLIPPGETLAGEVTDEERLDEDHPLFVSAVRWVRGSRFARKDDHRLAYACLPDLLRPDVVATFMVQIRDGEGWETERLMAVCVDCDGNVSRSAATDLEALSAHSSVNVAPERLVQVFGGWWQQVSARAAEEARRRAAEWRRAILVQRNSNQARLKDELDRWALAMRDAILGRHRTDYLQRDLFGQSTLPPAVKRRLRYHEERVRRLQEHLERRVCLDDPLVEPLGILLRLPEDIATPAADTSAGGR